jgi:hypothetical protein
VCEPRSAAELQRGETASALRVSDVYVCGVCGVCSECYVWCVYVFATTTENKGLLKTITFVK